MLAKAIREREHQIHTSSSRSWSRERAIDGAANPPRPSPALVSGLFCQEENLRGVWPREARRGSARGPLLPVETLAAQNLAGWTLVKAEAAGGGGRRPAFTRVWPATTIGGRGRWAEITPISRLIFRPSHAREDKGRRSSTSRAASSRRTWACAPSLEGIFD